MQPDGTYIQRRPPPDATGPALEGTHATLMALTLAQSELPRDTETLRTIARHNRAEIPGFGFFACAGVYAEVVRPGLVCQGDAVRGE